MSLRSFTTRGRLRIGAAGLALVVIGVGAAIVPAAAEPAHSPQSGTPKPTVVLVHGAWADSSSWSGVVRRLIHDGYAVDAFATPLNSLSGDAGALRTFIGSIAGPVILVGHSYGGAVITDAASGDDQVKALVYVDAFAPDLGEPVIALAGPQSALNEPGVLDPVPAGAPTPSTEFYVSQKAFVTDFANDLPRAQGQVLAAIQRPITYEALTDPSTAPAWKTIPSWYEVGTRDKVIPQSAQLSMARRAGAHITKASTGHLPMVSAPGVVTSLIERAARS
jgi:pimeloyl-ACP methyl ester carboxylesterase